MSRVWRDGDTVTLRWPMRPRPVAVDTQHPLRVAVMHGRAVDLTPRIREKLPCRSYFDIDRPRLV